MCVDKSRQMDEAEVNDRVESIRMHFRELYRMQMERETPEEDYTVK